MLKEQETAILAQYEAMLVAARCRSNEAQREIESLERIVVSMRERLDSLGPRARSSSGLASSDENPLPTYRGRATLPGFLKRLMADGRRRTLDQIAQAVEADANFVDRRPNRNTLSNRMHELMRSGYVQRVERGIYELAANAANENGRGRGGPNLTVHPARQQPPGEDLINPRPGHPNNEAERGRSVAAA